MLNLAKIWSPGRPMNGGSSVGQGTSAAPVGGSPAAGTIAEPDSVQRMLTGLLERAARGDFGGTVPPIDGTSPSAPLARAVERLLRRMEGFLKERGARIHSEREITPPPPPG